ncbi:MAG: hypothetical protein FVQ85_03545 [Planctomycetes bacterium]|nr:hypothetical protein [Planctomycetota bacterium]
MDPNTTYMVLTRFSFLSSVIIPLASALIGAIVVGIFTCRATVRGVCLNHETDLQRQKQAMKTLLQGFYRAILTEIETLWTRYQETAGHVVESLANNKPITYYYQVTQDYFVVYKSNATLVGHIPDRRLREILVKTYVEIQALIDSYNLNSQMVKRYGQLEDLFTETNNPFYQQKLSLLQSSLSDYAGKIQKTHYQLKGDVAKLIDALKDNIKPE